MNLCTIFLVLLNVSTLSQELKMEDDVHSSPYQKPLKSVRPPLIPTEEDAEKQEEGFIGSLGKLLANAGTSALEIMGGIFPGLKRKPVAYQYRNQGQYQQLNTWQSPESFEIPKEEEPPAIETRAPTPKKTYAFMSKDAEKMQQQLRQSRIFYSGWDTEFQQQQQQAQPQPRQQQQKHERHQHRHQHHSSMPQTFFEQSSEKTDEIVFGAVQEEGQRDSVTRPTDYAMIDFNQQNLRFRSGYFHNYAPYT